MTITVYADELLRLNVDDIGDEDLFDLKDPENWTEEHAAHFRKIVNERHQRDEKDRSRAVDADELGARLGYERLPLLIERFDSKPRTKPHSYERITRLPSNALPLVLKFNHRYGER
ncbi:uncharacterized protein PV06_11205 [Exophiala oligosperma]|uniref:Uncharacterized protein n=1 Tax=Exophiala oligosperma TaxID=215243 RepID=A0A0D2A8C0_9EURO|nr:uncharacterized protein PV06_11205 [Exophiala oligosperma]KIW36551.1 hypothetical protein PV06_11205 [Exophiala oligosperma]